MRWRPSSQIQVEDRRGAGGSAAASAACGMGGLGGGGIPIPVGGGLGGIVLIIIIIVVLNLLGGTGGTSDGGLQGGPAAARSPRSTRATTRQFINAVTVDVQTFWAERVHRQRASRIPRRRSSSSPARRSPAAASPRRQTGPFYCPADQKVYLDTGFFDELAVPLRGAGRVRRRPTSSPTSSAITSRTRSGRWTRSRPSSSRTRQGERALDPARAPGRLLRRRLGHSVWAQPDQANVESITEADVHEALNAAAGGRRRPDPAAGDGHDRQGVVDPRLRRPAGEVVQHGLQAAARSTAATRSRWRSREPPPARRRRDYFVFGGSVAVYSMASRDPGVDLRRRRRDPRRATPT